MAGKSRRVASRQSQLTSRKKRQQRGPSGIPAAERQPVSVAVDTAGDAPDGTLPDAASQPAAAAVATAAPRPAAPSPARSPSRAREERLSAYSYMGSELRRILIIATTGFAVLVALKFII